MKTIALLCRVVVGFALPALPAAAEDLAHRLSLGLPLLCKVGATCWVANYVDVDTSPGVRDFRCRLRSYDGHDGVDFALRDLAVMGPGVAVIASAAGRVKNIRDNMDDIAVIDPASRARIKGRECGNGVVIDHSDGWQTQYCHLRKNSIRVKPGEHVAAGTPLGLVGLSGHTEFPHVHLAARHNGAAVDPFTGQPSSAGCGKTARGLWRDDLNLAYETVALYNTGFASDAPDIEAIRRGEPVVQPFSVNAPALVVWVDMLGVEVGDRLQFRITQSDGRAVFQGEQKIEKTQARRFVYAGIRRKGNAWTAGTYTGEVTHTRVAEGQSLIKRVMTTVVVR